MTTHSTRSCRSSARTPAKRSAANLRSAPQPSTGRIANLHTMSSQTKPLLEAAADLMPDASRTTLRSWIEAGRFLVGNQPVCRANFPVPAGKPVRFFENQPRGGNALGMGVQLVYEDDYLLVVNKPVGLLSVAEDDGSRPSLHALLKRARRPERIFVVHRLDREASGLMLFAKEERTLWALKELFATHSLVRRYAAVVVGAPNNTTGCWRSYLQEGRDLRVREVARTKPTFHDIPRTVGSKKSLPTSSKERFPSKKVVEQESAVQEAITYWELVATGKQCSRLRLTLETGRKHQIRVHCSENGFPIVGDPRYGVEEPPCSRLCLHAEELSLVHPILQKELRWLAPPPKLFDQLVGQLG